MSRAVLFRVSPPLDWTGANFVLAFDCDCIGRTRKALTEDTSVIATRPRRLWFHGSYATGREALEELIRQGGYALAVPASGQCDANDSVNYVPTTHASRVRLRERLFRLSREGRNPTG